MQGNDFYPILFQPVYKDYIWGGDRIPTLFHRKAPKGRYAESWEVSDREDGMSLVENGSLKGASLNALVTTMGEHLLGKGKMLPYFPLLVKLIDAKENLSLQVHPDQVVAQRLGGEPKTEMWYVLDAEARSAVYVGFNQGVDEASILRALREKRFKDLMRKIPIKKGDVVNVPAGRVHAIGKGCLMLEVQQNSNTTYRLYDWDRVGADGKPRKLHLEESLKAIHWDDRGEPLVAQELLEEGEGWKRYHVLQTPYFQMRKLVLKEKITEIGDMSTFYLYFPIEGDLSVAAGGKTVKVACGRGCLVPAACEKKVLKPLADKTVVLEVSLP